MLLKSKATLYRWQEDIKQGGTIRDKYNIINSWVPGARANNQQVVTRNLQQWTLSVAAQFDNFSFKAFNAWVLKFKKIYKIRQRNITKFVSGNENATMEEILAAAESFRKQTRLLIPNFDENFVINTDQTGKFCA